VALAAAAYFFALNTNQLLVERLFRAWSLFYDNPIQQRLYFGPIQDAVLRRLGSAPGRVLDLGCGTGELLAKLPADTFMTGIDLSVAMLQQGVQKPALGGRLVAADAHALPLADQSMDVVTCLISFQYYLDPLTALREVHRVLKPGGRFFLGALSSRVLEVSPVDEVLRRVLGGLARFYRPSELRGLLSEAGFSAQKDRPVQLLTRLYEASV